MSWKKLEKIDRENLYLAKSNTHLAAQLASVAGQTYLEGIREGDNSVLKWNERTASLNSLHFGDKKNVQIGIDMNNFNLNILVEEMIFESAKIEGKNFSELAEWLSKKLAILQMNPSLFEGQLPKIISNAKKGAEIPFEKVPSKAYKELSLYFHNAHYILNRFNAERFKKKKKIYMYPQQFNFSLIHELEDNSKTILGFTPADNYYPEPYFYVTTLPFLNKNIAKEYKPLVGKWHTDTWTGIVLTASEVIKEKDELEEHITFDFLTNGFEITRKVLA